MRVLLLVVLVLGASACGADADETSAPASETSTTAPAVASTEAAPVAATVVRFSGTGETVDVTMGEPTDATRSFLSKLPMTINLEELSGREKISYLPTPLDVGTSPGSDPEDGDLIYFTPWDNLGFYYNADGIEYSDKTLHLGTYEASVDELTRLSAGPVQVALATP